MAKRAEAHVRSDVFSHRNQRNAEHRDACGAYTDDTSAVPMVNYSRSSAGFQQTTKRLIMILNYLDY